MKGNSLKHFEELDAFRGLAILMVIVVHAAEASHVKDWLLLFAYDGQRGVQLFYVISAFTLFLTLDHPRPESNKTLNFYIRRFFRIAPMFYLAVAARLMILGKGNLTGVEIGSGFVFANGIFPNAINAVAIGGWSIAIETSFYLMLPFLHRVIKTTKQAVWWTVVSMAVCGPFSYFLASRHAHLSEYFSFEWFPVEFPVFMIGITAYFLWKKVRLMLEENSGFAKRRKTISLFLMIVSWAAFFGTTFCGDIVPHVNGLNTMVYFASLAFIGIILAMFLGEWRIFNNSFTRYMGKISYSVYLAHFYVVMTLVWFLQKHDGAVARFYQTHLDGNAFGFLFFAVAVSLFSVPLCTFFWRIVEQPGIRLGRAVIAHLEGRRANVLALRVDSATADSQF